ncbi:UDP-N-acetyl-D-mannosamine dehydrogenase [Aestuariispira insulae]|uniref:UDP-N-acetyl-D-mannosaminuronic acid dehydrogenase n=1 Tax=Aestuariispira insulae TaxID=1461337 RepID=A0A3D9HK42_9PROT|nr:UDP-N-acetyl-D-mannosamine dehydrogenase [Aestuariispira insulae]RED49882.1 UDP-N-acetyl-D-mannosaminuronic acid dehydrogenase [Aestuariispira insulae]
MDTNVKTVSVIGLGYVGLPTAAILASRGFDVIGVDVNEHAVRTINDGKVHIVEPDLDILVQASVTMGRLKATTEAQAADVFMLAVPTPFKDDKQPDLAYLEAATRSIAPVIKKGDMVILESTSPVGTTAAISSWLSEMRPDLAFPHQSKTPDVNLAHCPERILPGHVLRELVENDRIIGGITHECSEKAEAFYRTFVTGECILTNARTAELAKLVENSYRDVNIAFANELSVICDGLDIDVWELINLTNRHPRVNILQPGPGVGGHCIAVDPWFIVAQNPEDARLIRTAREVNDAKPHFVIDKVLAAADRFKAPKVACFGLTYKADIDDLRESPALDIVKLLSSKLDGEVIAVEPNISKLPASLENAGNISLMDSGDALDQADIAVFLVAHRQFKDIAPAALDSKVVIRTIKS